MRVKPLLRGQLDIYCEEFLSFIGRILAGEPASEENYLQIGERLRTLAREKVERLQDNLGIFNEEQLKFLSPISGEKKHKDKEVFLLMRQRARTLIRDFKAGDTRIEALTDGLICNVADVPEFQKYVWRVKNKKGDDSIVKMEICFPERAPYIAYGLKNTALPLSRRSWLIDYFLVPEDLSEILSVMAVVAILKRLFEAEGKEDERELFLEQMQERCGRRSFEDVISNGVVNTRPDWLIKETSYRLGDKITQFQYGVSLYFACTSLIRAFVTVSEMEEVRKKQVQGYRNAGEGRARSFQDLKDLPKATIKAMESSVLNEIFGFVEYDDEVDLKKVAIYEKQFVSFYETYCKELVDAKQNAVRFRKLGNHKASGLYYPFVRCLCVDFRMPTSMIHEFGHLVDYEKGSLSLKADFYKVRSAYEAALKSALRTDKDAAGVIKASGKYDLDYYLEPTEIFARSFEIYVKEELGVDNDLIPEKFNNVVYPAGEYYRGLVREYFHALLGGKEVLDAAA